MSKKCTCNALMAGECVCGAWETTEEQYIGKICNLKAELARLKKVLKKYKPVNRKQAIKIKEKWLKDHRVQK